MPIDLNAELLRGGITVVAGCVAAGFAAWLGVRVFLRQKEFELVKQRYLEGGLDSAAVHLASYQGKCAHNFARSLSVISTFRSCLRGSTDFDINELERGYLELDSSDFQWVPQQRIERLIGSHVFGKLYVRALGFALTSNDVTTVELKNRIRDAQVNLTKCGGAQGQKDATLEWLDKVSIVLSLQTDSITRFSSLVEELESLASIFQTKQLTFGNVSTFGRDSRVKAIVARFETLLADDLKKKPERPISLPDAEPGMIP
jgi:hypothetical protein